MMFEVIGTRLAGVKLIEPRVFSDERGFFLETFNLRDVAASLDIDGVFVQDNHSCSVQNVLRGMHYQTVRPQAKLIRVIEGGIFDAVVDLRRSSPTFGQWQAFELTAENHRQMYVPEGFAHGFLTLTPRAQVIYKTSDYWSPEHERSIAWNDPDVGIAWPLTGTAQPLLAKRDANAPRLRDADCFE
jgi:dTDP-4-dehydrorhamnose 3,5-epimerase